jgi:uncharacterized membrane protein YbhN (UPF0104 family)
VVLAIGALLQAVIAVLLTTGDRRDLASIVSPGHLFLAALLPFVPWFTNAGRVFVWTRFFGRPTRFRDALRIVLGTEIGAACVPLAVGGAPVKVGILVQHGFDTYTAVSLTAFTTVEDALFFMGAIPLALAFSGAPEVRAIERAASRNASSLAVGGGIAIGILLVLVGFGIAAGRTGKRPGPGWCWRVWDSIATSVRRLLEISMAVARNGKRALGATMILTAVQWSARYSVACALAWSLGVRIDPFLSFAFQWAVATLSLAAPTPGATLGAEASFLAMYQMAVPRDLLGTMAVGWRLLSFHGTLALGALIFIVLQPGIARNARLLPRSGGRRIQGEAAGA